METTEEKAQFPLSPPLPETAVGQVDPHRVDPHQMDPHQVDLAQVLTGRPFATAAHPLPGALPSVPHKLINARAPSFIEAVLKGMSCAMPIVVGYLPIAFAFGILSATSQVSFKAAVAMSVFVFAGSSQFIALGLIAGGAPLTTIVLTTFIVNLRHFLMSAAMLRYLRHWGWFKRLSFSIQMTDETFALNSTRLGLHPDSYPQVIATNLIAHLSWILGTVLGFLANGYLPQPEILGLDFALPAMFVALITFQLRSFLHLSAALIAVGILLLMKLSPFPEWAVMTAAILAALVAGLQED